MAVAIWVRRTALPWPRLAPCLTPNCALFCRQSQLPSAQSAERYRASYGYERAAWDWHDLVHDPKVEAVVIASPQDTHEAIAREAIALGKPVLCEKPIADTIEGARKMVELAEGANVPNMVGFNYIRTPASRFAHDLIQAGEIGDITWFRCEHTEDFFPIPICQKTGDARGWPRATWAIWPPTP